MLFGDTFRTLGPGSPVLQVLPRPLGEQVAHVPYAVCVVRIVVPGELALGHDAGAGGRDVILLRMGEPPAPVEGVIAKVVKPEHFFGDRLAGHVGDRLSILTAARHRLVPAYHPRPSNVHIAEGVTQSERTSLAVV